MIQIRVPFILMAYLWSDAYCANNGDCSFETIRDAALKVHYYADPNFKFPADEESYKKFCAAHMDATDVMLAYADRCLKGRGKELFKKTVRSPQYEVMHVCHPDGDATLTENFKAVAKCYPMVYPKLKICTDTYSWNLDNVVKNSTVDIPRFCCTKYEMIDCISTAGKGCPPENPTQFERVGPTYHGNAVQMLCPDTPEHEDPSKCKALPPIQKTGDKPPLPYESLVKIAMALQ